MDIVQYYKPWRLALAPAAVMATALMVLGAALIGLIEPIPSALERAEMLVPALTLLEKELFSERQTLAAEHRKNAASALARLKLNPELQLPVAQSYAGLIPVESGCELVAHPRDRNYKLLIRVPKRILPEDKERFRTQAAQETAICEERFERLLREGTPIAQHLRSAESAWRQVTGALSLVVNRALLDPEWREESRNWLPDADIALLLDQRLGWDNSLLRVPKFDIALSVEESGQKIGHSVVMALPLFGLDKSNSGTGQLGALHRWDCHIWELWSVMRDRNGETLTAQDGIMYHPSTDAALVSHIWASYAIPDGGFSQRELFALSSNPVAHLAVYLAYSWDRGLRLDDPRVKGFLPERYVAAVDEEPGTYPTPHMLHWGGYFVVGHRDLDFKKKSDLLKLYEIPGTDLLGLVPE